MDETESRPGVSDEPVPGACRGRDMETQRYGTIHRRGSTNTENPVEVQRSRNPATKELRRGTRRA